MYAPLWCLCIVVASTIADNPVVNDCILSGGDKKSAAELALLQKLAPLKNKRFEASFNEGDSYKYTFVVCGQVNVSANSYAGLVQSKAGSAETTVIGRFNDTHLVGGTDWIMLFYKSGDKYDSHCGKEPRQAMVMISCNKYTLGDAFKVIMEERNKTSNCFYLFELDSSVACPAEESHLSVGSILLIVFAVLVAAYIFSGFLYKRFIVGAKGVEQFPNITFWQEFGNLTADGCDFVCRSRPRSSETTYRGVGDDQLGEEPEERDDHLLPM